MADAVRAIIFSSLVFIAAALFATSAKAVEQQGETLEQTICRLIETAAAANTLPADFLTRLIWRESSFRPGVTSSAGAQGIAQFMPGTANEQNLDDPFDPEQAIPASAAFLAGLRARFGNLGLAAAAYNAGPARVAGWIAKGGSLPIETEDYVRFITGRSVDDWASPDGRKIDRPDPPSAKCAVVVTAIRSSSPRAIEGPYAPFGVQLSGNFSKSRALASYQRVAARFPSIIGGRSTLVIGTRMAGRGRHAFYRVRLAARSMRDAAALCGRLQQAGGACIVLRN